VDGIIGPRRRIAFSVGMLFAFIALSVHFANIFLAGRGAMLTTTSEMKHDIESLKFYLAICGNLQVASTVLFLVSIVVMIFLIFSSIAFPLVLLFLSGIGALIVFTSAYWEISISLANIQFLAANIGRLKSSLDSLRRSTRAARLRPSRTV
jgi:glucan phosphoethanolaminetransferase (alkaline phosphatase superfamily)